MCISSMVVLLHKRFKSSASHTVMSHVFQLSQKVFYFSEIIFSAIYAERDMSLSHKV